MEIINLKIEIKKGAVPEIYMGPSTVGRVSIWPVSNYTNWLIVENYLSIHQINKYGKSYAVLFFTSSQFAEMDIEYLFAQCIDDACILYYYI